MTARYLLDTNIVSDLIRNPQGKAAQAVIAVGSENVCTSIIVLSEVRFGIVKKGSARLAAQLDEVLEGLDVLPLETPADERYAALRTALERKGAPISANDYLIAAHALATNCILVTDNEREFRRVDGLTVENWLR